MGAVGDALHDDINVTSPRTCQQPDELGVRMIDMGTNTSDVEMTPQRDGSRIMTLEGNVQASCPLVDVILPNGMNEQVAMPHINFSLSGYDPESLRGSHIRTQDTGIQENSIIPRLDGPVSIPIRDRRRLLENIRIEQEYPKKVHIFKGLLCHAEGNIPEIVVMIMIEEHIGIEDPLKEEGIQIRVEDCLIEGGIPIGIEGLLEEEDILEEDP